MDFEESGCPSTKTFDPLVAAEADTALKLNNNTHTIDIIDNLFNKEPPIYN
ncbi:hypothetical protein PbDSM24746_23050 [Paenibacillus macerans]|nr:hypothetical protein PbDSM24746_23050 [Paenibacillus macerans]GBK68613.1 hypothetical protein PbJCM17693_23210 [Paenibacillus macerans]GIP11683.1 hypothetical protein J1TS5_38530 [Paenibacillus macerans]